ncbi:hypothetical protein PROFUN_05750 [Planoprotostelium fungivorum]|uniref:Uncharacterized protein n=1 Tax=Planoprotostelium fungivorum TaxID=1890364 RepID=A0A2P6NQL8_9EUKA|nr:hypothetical protein PROFUN_05750 [Planoprotostelium fungivorum]
MAEEVHVKAPNACKYDPVEKMTTSMILYVVIMKMVGAMFLNFAINFGIGIAQYIHKSPIRIWQFPNTLAGDTAVTIFIQGVLSWVIDGMLTSNDVRRGDWPWHLRPLRPPAWIQHSEGVTRWFFSSNPDLLEPGISFKTRLIRLAHQIPRALIYCLPIFVIFWPLSIGFLYAYNRDGYIEPGFPAAALFKGFLGGSMGFFQTAPSTLFAFYKKGERLHVNVEQGETTGLLSDGRNVGWYTEGQDVARRDALVEVTMEKESGENKREAEQNTQV